MLDSKPLADPEHPPLFDPLPTIVPELARIPASHHHLLDDPYWAALTTVMLSEQLQTTPIWCNRDGDYLLFNTMRGFLKEKNMRVNPCVSLLIYNPHNPHHFIEIAGLVVEMTEAGAVEHNDLLTQLYTGKPEACFFGDAIPAEMAATYHPVKVRMAPLRVRTESSNGKAEANTVIPVSIKNKILTPPVEIPQSHQDLLLRPVYGVLATLLPDDQPYSSLVWVDYDGAELPISTTFEAQECQNLQAKPKVTLLVVDPDDASRYLEVRGQVVEISTEGTIAHAITLAGRYSSSELSGGRLSQGEQTHPPTRVIIRIRPLKVTHDAFFNRAGGSTL